LPETASGAAPRRTRSALFLDLCLLGVGTLAVALRAAKAHRGGVIFDEAYSYYYYARRIGRIGNSSRLSEFR
jgi:hypothetical protein